MSSAMASLLSESQKACLKKPVNSPRISVPVILLIVMYFSH